jgi:hypothetical protein
MLLGSLMSKSTTQPEKKLPLTTETVRVLDDAAVQTAAGGKSGQVLQGIKDVIEFTREPQSGL